MFGLVSFRLFRVMVTPVVALLVIACSADLTASPDATGDSGAVASLRVLTPGDGAVVETSVVTFAGTAPVGAEVVRDITLAPDDQVTAVDGTWTLDVNLDEGENEITLRLGDDDSTAQTFRVTYTPVAAATGEVTPAPPAEPTLEANPAPQFATFEDGTQEIGTDVQPGTYRLREPAEFCYWARLKGFDGSLDEIIANDNVVSAYAVVTIGKNDVGFESSGCGEWSADLSPVTSSTSKFETDGTYIVGKDIRAGKWRATGGEFCYWARLKNFGGTLSGILANDNVLGGRTVVTIRSTDKGFTAKGCGTWTRS